MIILVGGEKGGTGKTTLAVNLAAFRQHQGRAVVIIDTDRQASAADWCYFRRAAGLDPIDCQQLNASRLIERAPALADHYQDVIIDAGGRDSPELRAGLLVADLVLLPVRAAQYDLASLDTAAALIRQARKQNPRLRALVAVNALKPNPRLPEFSEALQVIQTYSDIDVFMSPIIDRIAYARSGAEGRGAHELDPKAAAEIQTLNTEIGNDKI